MCDFKYRVRRKKKKKKKGQIYIGWKVDGEFVKFKLRSKK